MRCECQSPSEESPFTHEPWDEPVNTSKIVLSDTETYSELESLNVISLDDYTRNIQTGEQVIVTGSLQRITLRGSPPKVSNLPYLAYSIYRGESVNGSADDAYTPMRRDNMLYSVFDI